MLLDGPSNSAETICCGLAIGDTDNSLYDNGV